MGGTRRRKVAYRKRRQNRLGMLLVTTVVIMMIVVVSINNSNLRKKQEQNQAEIEQLEKLIAEEEARSEEIEEYRIYTQTKKFVEEYAKDKLGLVYENEILFKNADN